ncbi:MAG: Hpt domain-containing protein [Rectinemataceae bacterium]
MDQTEENWNDSPILDFAIFDDMVLRMEEVAVEIVQIFLTESPARMVILAEAIEGGDLEGVLDVVHRFKSSSALLGGMRLSKLCEMLELRLRKERKLRGLEAELRAAQELLGPTLAAIESRWEKSAGTA